MLSVSYQHAAEDIEYFTGVPVSRSVQQRLVHRQDFALAEAEATVKELSVDGGNIRICTPVGEPCGWKGYKAVCLHEQGAVAASFHDNAVMIDWVNTQPLAAVLTCIGDEYQRQTSSPHHQLPVLSSRADLLHWLWCSRING